MRWIILAFVLCVVGCGTVTTFEDELPAASAPERVEPGKQGYYRIPLYDSEGNRTWLYLPNYTNSLILLRGAAYE